MDADQIPHLRDSMDRMWLGSSSGLSVEVPGALEKMIVAPPGFYQQLLEDKEGNIWATAENHGLLRVSEASVHSITPAQGLSDQTALALLEDSERGIWIATNDGSLNWYCKNKVAIYHVSQPGEKNKVTALGLDRFGTIWAATTQGEIYQKVGEQFEQVKIETNCGQIHAITLCQDGDLILGGQRGLFRYSEGTFTKISQRLISKVDDVSAIVEGANGHAWVGTENGVLYEGSWDHLTPIFNETVLRRRAISAILPDEEGTVWIATMAGLVRWKAGSYLLFTHKEGLPDDRLTSVVDDQLGHLWIGTPTGIFRLSKAELLNWSNDRKDILNSELLDRSDGLTSQECTDEASPSAIRCRDGHILFPTIDGVAMICPDRFPLTLSAPQVVINDCHVNGQVLSPPFTKLQIGPGPVRLDIDYTALSLTAPEKVRFRIRLDGIDTDWKEVWNRRSVSYLDLKPGNYRFHVIATSGNGVWNERGAQLLIQVAPHIWERLWFRATILFFLITLATGCGWSLAQRRLRKRLAIAGIVMSHQAERMRIAQDLHDDLGSRLTEISLLAGLAADESADEERRHGVLPVLADKTRHLAAVLDEVVWAVNPHYDSIASLADYLAAFASDLLGAANISVRFSMPGDYPQMILDQTQRHSLFLAVSEALNNAAKYSRASQVELRMWMDNDHLEIIVKDNGCGFDQHTTGLGNGLKNMADRLAKLGGLCTLKSDYGTGTEVHFIVPILKGHPGLQS